MGFIFSMVKSLLRTIIKLFLYLAIVATIIILIPNLPPYTKFTSIEISPTQPRIGPLAINGALNNPGKSYNGKLLGPEAFQIFKGELYTSLATGEIVKLTPEGHVTFVTTFGEPCSGIIQEHICGRPLGILIDDKDESLYAADAYHGIWKVDLKTNKKQLLVSPRVEIEKRQPKLFNSIAKGNKGDLYWTDSSSEFHLKDGVISLMTDPSGRLFHYDAAKNQSKVLLDGLWFPNGLVVSPNNDFVVVSESARARIMKYYISGPKKGQTEVFVDGLPGVPDNSRALPDGSGILVALYSVFEEDRPPLPHLLAATPLVRKLIARLHRLIEIPFEYANNIYPHIVFEQILYNVGHFKTVTGLTPALSGLLQIDWDGNIVAGYYNIDKSLGHISDAIVFNDKLYTGSPHLQDFLGTLPVPPLLKKAFETKKSEIPKDDSSSPKTKPVQQAPTKKTEDKLKAKVEEKPKVETKPKAKEAPKAAQHDTKPNKEVPKVAKPAATVSTPPPQAKPVSQQPAAKTAPQKPPAQEPAVKPAVQQPAVQQSDTKSTAQQPATKPTAQQPAAKPAAQQPAAKPAAQQPAAKPIAQQPAAKPTTQQPVAKPTAQQPAAKPTAQQPAAKPTAQQPAAKPTAQPPAAKPTAQQPAAKPAAQQPATKPAAQQPAGKPAAQPPAAKPVVQEPTTQPASQQASQPTPAKPDSAKNVRQTEPKTETNTPPSKPSLKTDTTPQKSKNDAPNKVENPVKDSSRTPEIKPRPIKEEIPSDTAKPIKETLKVIKKDGPAEIPVANQ